MNAVIIQAEHVAPQPWRNGGGQTRELLVWPPPRSLGGKAFCAGKGGARKAGGGHGAERFAAQTSSPSQHPTTDGWKLRISRADIEADDPFSAFAGVQRWFVVISGKGIVLHMPTTDGLKMDHQLLPGHAPLHFDGGLAPGCRLLDGATQDLNLMARGGVACMQAVNADEAWSADFAMRGLYTACNGEWSDGAQTIALPAHSLLWIENACALPNAAFCFTANDTEPTRAWWLGYTPDPTP